MKFTPRSTARCNAAIDVASSVGPYEFPCAFPPMAHAAKPILIVFLLMATALTALTVSPAARGATLINSQLSEETGPTTALGGGDHVFVRFGTDAAFGVVYGTTGNPNNIYVVAIKARYLGVAQVVDQSGASVAS